MSVSVMPSIPLTAEPPPRFTTSELPLLNFGARCEAECVNTNLHKEGCDDRAVILPTGVEVDPGEICNDICDVQMCEDEAISNQ